VAEGYRGAAVPGWWATSAAGTHLHAAREREDLPGGRLAAYGLFADGVAGAEVIIVASDARQAGITHRQVARMVELEPRLAEQEQVFQNRIYVPHTDSTLTVLPAEPGALQGWNPSLAIVEDELHVVTRPVRDAAALAAGEAGPRTFS
jgi:phage terminase large subunit-like protein